MLNLLKDIFPVTVVLLVIFGILYLIFLPAIAEWKLFKKAGIPGWKSLIPLYNSYLLFKISGMPGLLFLVSTFLAVTDVIYKDTKPTDVMAIIIFAFLIINIIVTIVHSIKLSKAFGKGAVFMIFMIFFPTICKIIIGYGSSKYVGPYKPKKY